MKKLLVSAVAAFAVMGATLAFAVDATGAITKIDAPTRAVTLADGKIRGVPSSYAAKTCSSDRFGLRAALGSQQFIRTRAARFHRRYRSPARRICSAARHSAEPAGSGTEP